MLWIREQIDKMPSFSYLETHISMIEESVETNPALCIETCKSLIEGVCKTILKNQGAAYDDSKFHTLVQHTISHICQGSTAYKTDLVELGSRVASVAWKLAQIRNAAGFAGHGQDALHSPIDGSLSLFTYKVTDALGGFILHYYIKHSAKVDSRIHYEDWREFNELFDEENPLELAGVILSASEALYKQDYEAYREILYSYLDNLEK